MKFTVIKYTSISAEALSAVMVLFMDIKFNRRTIFTPLAFGR